MYSSKRPVRSRLSSGNNWLFGLELLLPVQDLCGLRFTSQGTLYLDTCQRIYICILLNDTSGGFAPVCSHARALFGDVQRSPYWSPLSFISLSSPDSEAATHPTSHSPS